MNADIDRDYRHEVNADIWFYLIGDQWRETIAHCYQEEGCCFVEDFEALDQGVFERSEMHQITCCEQSAVCHCCNLYPDKIGAIERDVHY